MYIFLSRVPVAITISPEVAVAPPKFSVPVNGIPFSVTPVYRLSMYLDILSPPPRHPRQTTANYAFTLRSARRSAALNLILHISSTTWCVLGFLYRLRRPARLRAAYRAATLRIISSPPTPLLGFDLGFSNLTNDLVLRTPTGNFISHHPSSPNLPMSHDRLMIKYFNNAMNSLNNVMNL